MQYINRHKDKIKTIGYCFIVAFIILMFTSKCSFLYPFNDWLDANAFFTVGKSMMNGLVPFLDIFEQKGILLYLIYGVGYLISHKSFIGVFILEVLFWTVSLYYVIKIIKLFLDKKWCYILTPLFTALVCTSYAFTHGGGAEEFCLPFFCITMYYFLDHFKDNEISYKRLFIAGLCAGAVLLIKYTLLGFWFAFMATLFFVLLKEKKVKKAFLACLVFLLGMFIPFLISLIYFAIHHGIKKYIDVYFIFNMTSYSNDALNIVERLHSIFKGFADATYSNGPLVMLLIYFMPLLILKMDMSWEGKISLIIVFLFTILGLYWGLRFYRYYLFPMEIFMLISLIALAKMIGKVKAKQLNIAIGIISCFALYISYFWANGYDLRFKNKDNLFQAKFAKIINEEENPTLLSMGNVDCGVFTLTGIIPSTYYFARHNVNYDKYPDNFDSLERYITNKEVMFVVFFTNKFDLEKLQIEEPTLFKNYNLISQEKYRYEDKKYNAFLFKVKDNM